MKINCVVKAIAFAVATGMVSISVKAADESSISLEEIVVTAQKREENLQHAALAVSAVTGSTLDRVGVVDAAALTRVVPALQISSGFATSNVFYLRGVGNNVLNSFSDSAVSFNVDGIYAAHVSSTSGVFFDLDRVEVLKGPQGTLYGRNSTGGAINIITAKPKLGEMSGHATVEFGNYDDKKFDGAINLPLGASSALRIAGQAIDRSGFYDDGTGDDREQALRLSYLYSSDRVKLTAGATYQHVGGVGAGTTLRGLNPADRIGNTSPAAGAIYASTPTFASVGLGTIFLHPLNRADLHNDNTSYDAYVQADISTPAGTATILPSYSHTKLDYINPAAGFMASSLQKFDTTSVEARLVSDKESRLNYILGAFYYNDDTQERSGFNQDARAFWVNFKPKVSSYAGYARLTFSLTDELRLTGGVRYTSDDKTASYSSINALVACFAPAVCPHTPALPNGAYAPSFLFNYAANQVVPFQPWGATGAGLVGLFQERADLSKRFNKTNYRLGVEYDVAPQSLLYATFETGFKSGGFFVSVDDPTFRPEEITAFTLGSKNRFMENRLQANVELYDWTYKDQQFSHFRINSQGAPEFVTENIGKTNFQGVELELQARAAQNTTITSSIQYNHSKNKQFTYKSPLPVATGCPVTPGVVFTVDCSGFPAPHAPLWTIMAGLEQRIPLGGASDLTFNADWRFQSANFANIELTPEELQPGYHLVDFSLNYTNAGNHFRGALFVNNAFDRIAAGFIQYNYAQSFIPSVYTTNLIAPRTYGVRLGYKF
jgi:iron complex outermembrane receptor protein